MMKTLVEHAMSLGADHMVRCSELHGVPSGVHRRTDRSGRPDGSADLHALGTRRASISSQDQPVAFDDLCTIAQSVSSQGVRINDAEDTSLRREPYAVH